MATLSVGHLADPFGLSSAGAERSRDVAKAMLSPWWRYFSGPEIQESQSAVVLEQQTQGAPWPPSWPVQAQALARIAAQCPAVIAVDLLYDVERPEPVSIGELIARDVIASPAVKACAKPLFLIFGDYPTRVPGLRLRRTEFRDPIFLRCDGRDTEPCETGPLPSLGVIGWSQTDENQSSPFFETSSDRYYRLLSLVGGQTPEETGRPTLALAAFLSWCLYVRDDSQFACPRRIREIAAARFGHESGGIGASMLAGPELRAMFAAPMDVAWPRWPEPAQFEFESIDGAAACDPDAVRSFAQRLAEMGRMFIYSLFGKFDGLLKRTFGPITCLGFPALTMTGARLRAKATGASNGRDAPEAPDVALAQYLTGKVVFYGFDDATSKDIVESPVHGERPGIFRHVIAFENLALFGAEGYLVRPATRFKSLPWMPIGPRDALEIVCLFAVGSLVLWRRNSEAERTRLRAAIDHLDRHDRTTFSGVARSAWPWLTCVVLRRVTVFLWTFAVTLAIMFIPFCFFNWSMSNWINVGALSGGAVLAVEYVFANVGALRRSKPVS